jgi:serine/threonine-protein kinase HipA
MARKPHSGVLHIWMNGLHVGLWETGSAEESLVYSPAWVTHPQGRPLSISLPFLEENVAHKGKVVHDFFDNLLPDSEAIRRRLAQHHKIGGTSPFQLLGVLGRDCVGAIQLLPSGETPEGLKSIEGDVLDDAQIAQLLRDAVSGTPLGHDDRSGDLRLSIAGAQEKTALLRHHDQWLRPYGSTPTTHIFKLPMGLVGAMKADMQASVENEWLCSKLAAAYGLPVAHCDMARFEDQKVLIVERFDRRLSSDGSHYLRLPQEDFCQATATSPLAKYQADGGPGITAIMRLLASSTDAGTDLRSFYKAQIFFWLLAATDGHAKNFSVAMLARGDYRATPLYDILSAHPVIGKRANQIAPARAKLAMGVRGASGLHYRIGEIRRRHWYSHAKEVGLAAAIVDKLIEELLEATPAVLDNVQARLPKNFPAAVADSIFKGLRAQADKLAAQENSLD